MSAEPRTGIGGFIDRITGRAEMEREMREALRELRAGLVEVGENQLTLAQNLEGLASKTASFSTTATHRFTGMAAELKTMRAVLSEAVQSHAELTQRVAEIERAVDDAPAPTGAMRG